MWISTYAWSVSTIERDTCRDGGQGLKILNQYNINIGQNTHHNKRANTTLHKEKPKTAT